MSHNMRSSTLLIFFGIAIRSGIGTDLPNYINPCQASDEICLKNTLQALKPHLAQGIREFKLPSIVPLKIPACNYSRNVSPDLVYSAAFANMKFDHVNKFNVSNFKVDLQNLKFLLVLDFPQVSLLMHEIASGKAIGIDVQWDGVARLIFKNLTIKFSLDGQQLFKNGKQFIHWKKAEVEIFTDLIIYDIEGLLHDKELATIASQKIAENQDIVDNEVRFIIRNTLAEYIFGVIELVHDRFPINVLYASQ